MFVPFYAAIILHQRFLIFTRIWTVKNTKLNTNGLFSFKDMEPLFLSTPGNSVARSKHDNKRAVVASLLSCTTS